jgi:hypothetical protein
VIRAGAAKGPQSSGTNCSRSDRPIWWQCGDVGHLKRNCQQEYPQDCMWGQLGPEKQAEAGSKNVLPLASHTWCDDNLKAEDQIGNMLCLGITETGASMTIARYITTGLSQREPTWLYILQMVSDKTLPLQKEVTMGQHPLRTWGFAAKITDKFILELDVLHVHDAPVDLGYLVLRVGKEDMQLWCHGASPHSFLPNKR